MSEKSRSPSTFSQRTGLAELPQQLQLGEISEDFRRLVGYAISKEIRKNQHVSYFGIIYNSSWEEFLQDFFVMFLNKRVSDFPGFQETNRILEHLVDIREWNRIFDGLEFILQHGKCSAELKEGLREAFVQARLAYRVGPDGRIMAIGTAEEAKAVLGAINEAQKTGAEGARKHLVEAGVFLRNGRWSDSVRESIHAVETVATHLSGKNTLSEALKALYKNNACHPALIASFEKLYAWTSDEKGVRHATVFEGGEGRVDEADALFMLGACASFVSYLLSKFGSKT